MTNIPTDLLRTLVEVVDPRSFTKAAIRLGVTQPAVSTQIRRLQFLLGADLFVRSQGVVLTPQGELVVAYARRLLSVNDQIVEIGGSGPRPERVIRIGAKSDVVASMLPGILVQFRERWPHVRFMIRTGLFDPLAHQLRSGEIDVMLGLSMAPPHDARHSRVRDIVWTHSAVTRIEPDRPVPLVSYGQASVYHRIAATTLKSAGLDWEDVFIGPSFTSLRGAVSAGMGIMAITRHRAISTGMTIWEDTPLPKLPDLYAGIYIRKAGPDAIYEQLADELARNLWDAEFGPSRTAVTEQTSIRSIV
jgi:DNA-binding transcriptional LysR family regulator